MLHYVMLRHVPSRHVTSHCTVLWQSKLNLDFAGIFAVPSENKRDLRSIEETLNDIRKRKKFRPGEVDDEEDDVEAEDNG